MTAWSRETPTTWLVSLRMLLWDTNQLICFFKPCIWGSSLFRSFNFALKYFPRVFLHLLCNITHTYIAHVHNKTATIPVPFTHNIENITNMVIVLLYSLPVKIPPFPNLWIKYQVIFNLLCIIPRPIFIVLLNVSLNNIYIYLHLHAL